MPAPISRFSVLHQADGSVEFSHGGYTVIGAVNGPIEAQRRDELPKEAAIEINVRPPTGTGTIRERHLESIIHSTLRRVILTRQFPRTLIQVTLQIVAVPEKLDAAVAARFSAQNTALYLLPSLLHTSLLALLAAWIPLCTTFTSTICAVTRSGSVKHDPTTKELADASSIHIFAFTPHGRLLLSESHGKCSIAEWDAACSVAERHCSSKKSEWRQDDEMAEEEADHEENLHAALTRLVVEKISMDQRWKQST